MTWAEAKQAAEPRANAMLERLRAAGATQGAEVRLSIYDDSAWTIFGDSGGGEWSREDHENITRAAARIISRAGYRPNFVQIHGAEYLDWLVKEHRENSAESRAVYAGQRQGG